MRDETTRSRVRSPRSGRDLRSLVELVAQLRAPDGCPWDQRQTHESLKGLLIEEAYETVAAIESEDRDALAEELGDLLLHAAFHIQIARESEAFDTSEVVDGITDKLIRRHPHVFGEVEHDDETAVNEQWEQLKRREKRSGRSADGDAALPALIAARKYLDKRTHLREMSPVVYDDGLHRLVTSRLDDPDAGTQLGTMLLQIVDAARERGLEPELCLRQTLSSLEAEDRA